MKKLFTSFKRFALSALFLTMALSGYSDTFYLWQGTSNDPASATRVQSATVSGNTVTFTVDNLNTSTSYYFGMSKNKDTYSGMCWTLNISQTGSVGKDGTPTFQQYNRDNTTFQWSRIISAYSSIKITGTWTASTAGNQNGDISLVFAPGFTVTADKSRVSLLEAVTLTAQGGTAPYVWKASYDGGATYSETLSGSGASVTVYPSQNMYYKCTDNTGRVAYIDIELSATCTGENQHELFVERFGEEFTNQTDRSSNVYVLNYNYMSSCKAMKNAGDYAVVVNPYYGGCGNQAEGDNSCNCGSEQWFRNTLDHTREIPPYYPSGTYGGMLMFNCKDGTTTNDVLYERTVDVPCPNTLLNVSIFVKAAWDPDRGNDPIDTKFVLREGEGGSGTILAQYEINDLDVSADWTPIERTFITDKTQVTIQFVNLNKDGNVGNDLLIDDITFYACRPDAYLYVAGDLTAKKTTAEVVGPYNNGNHFDTVELEAVVSTTTLTNPYYYWVRNVSGTWVVVNQGFGDTFKTYTVPSTAPGEYKVGIGPDASSAQGAISGSAGVCGMATATNSVTVTAKDIPLDLDLASELCKGSETMYRIYVTNPFDYDIDNVNVVLQVSADGAFSNTHVENLTPGLTDIVGTMYSEIYWKVLIDNLPAGQTVSFAYYATPTIYTENLQNTAKAFIEYIKGQKRETCSGNACMWNADFNDTPDASRDEVVGRIQETCDDISLSVGTSELLPCYGMADSFNITLRNNLSKASNPTGIQLAMPACLDVAYISGTGFTYDATTGIISSTSIPGGAVRTCTVYVTTDAVGSGTINMELTTDHTKSAFINVTVEECMPELSISMNNEFVCYGTTADQFTVTVYNPYGFTLENVKVGCSWSENAQSGVRITKTSGTTYDAGIWTIPSIASGNRAVLTYAYEANVAGENTAKAWMYDIFSLGRNYTYATSSVKTSMSQTVREPLDARIAVTGASQVCAGTGSQITITPVTGTAPYTIVYNNGTSNITLSDVYDPVVIPVTPAATTTYSLVSMTDNEECTITFPADKSVTILVDPQPVGSAGTLNPHCNNDIFQLAGSLEVGSGVWTASQTGIIINNPTSPVTQISGVPLNGDVEMIWTVSSGVCPVVTSSVHAINNDCRDITVTIDGVKDICAGSDLNYTITVTNSSTLDANNVNVIYTIDRTETMSFSYIEAGESKVIGVTYSADKATTTSTKNISVTAQKEGGSAISDSKTFTVNPLPANQTITASATSYCAGNSVSIGLAGSQYGVTYTLYRNTGAPAASPAVGTGNAFNFDGGFTQDKYKVKAVYDATSCQVDFADEVTIKENKVPSATISGGTSICANSSANLIFDVTDYYGSYTVTYKTESTGAETRVNTSSAQVSPRATETYNVVKVEDANGCVRTYSAPYADDQTATVVVDNVPESNAGTNQTQFNNSTFNMAANQPQAGETGEWTIVSVVPATPAGPTITNPTKYNTTVTGVEVGSTVTLKWTVSSALRVCQAAESTVTLINRDGTDLGILSQFENSANCANGEHKLTLTLTNGASRTATNVVVSNAIVNASIKSVETTTGTSYDKTSNVWTIGDMAAGASVTLTAYVTPAYTNRNVTIEDKAYVSSANGINYASYDDAPAALKTSANTISHAVPSISADVDATPTDNTSCDDNAPNGSITVKAGFNGYSFDGGATWTTSNTLTGIKDTKTYQIKVRNEYGCESNLIEVTVNNLSVKPVIQRVNTTNGGAYCEGDESNVHIVVAGSQREFEYQLYIDNSTTSTPELEPVGRRMPGTGNEIDFGAFGAGKYYVEAISNISETCSAFMNDNAVVITENKLNVYEIKTAGGETKYCANTAGVEILLSGSQNGNQFVYTLSNATGAVAEKFGTGSQLSFGKQKAGEYRISARNTLTGCSANMEGFVIIEENKVPSATISDGASICVNSSTNLTLDVTDYYGSYTVTYKTKSTGAETAVSTNSFSVSPRATETYNVVKVEDANGCVRAYSAPYADDQTATVVVDNTPVSNAGTNQTQFNNSTFTMAANQPQAGETGEWTIVSVVPATPAGPTITNPTKYNTTVTGVEVGSTVTLKWTVSSALRVCPAAESTVVISNVDGTDLRITSQFDNRTHCATDKPELTIRITNGASRTATNVAVSNAITNASIEAGSVVVSSGRYYEADNLWVVGDMVAGGFVTLTASVIPEYSNMDVTIEDRAYVSNANGINYASYDEAPASLKTSATTMSHAVPSISDADVTPVNNISCDDAELTGSITVKAGFYEYSFDGGATWTTNNVLSGLKNGTYNVMVRSPYECKSGAVTADVKNDAVPAVIQRVNATNNGEYCEGTESDVHIVVAGSQRGFEYQLYIDNSTTSTPELAPVGRRMPGTDTEIDFGAFGAGKYYVEAISTISGTCSAFMNDNAVVITENPKPEMTYKVTDKATGTEIIAPYVITCNVPEMEIQLSGADGYVWRDGTTDATKIVTEEFHQSVYPVSDKGCVGEIVEININIDKETPKDVVITSDPADADLTLTCKNQEITLTASSSTADVTYKWNDAAHTEGAELKVSDISAQNVYKVTVTAANGCTSESEVEVKENKTKPVVSVVSTDETGEVNEKLNCIHPELTLTASVSNTQIVGDCTYEWSTLSEASFSDVNPLVVTSANVYSVVATGENGCTSAKVDKVINEDFRKPEVITEPVAVCMPATVDISTAVSRSSKFDEIFYYETEGATAPMTSTIVEVSDAATYYAQAVGLDGNGCPSEYTPIVISERSIADVPTVVPYDECPIAGQKSMKDLVTSDKTNLKFYDSMEGGNEVSDMFDAATENSYYTYYVSNTAKDQCESGRAEINIHVDGTIDYDLLSSADEVIAAQDEVTISVVPTKDATIEKYVWTKNGVQMDSNEPEVTDILFANSEFAVTASGRCNSVTKKTTVRALWPTVIIPDDPGKNGEFARGCNITVFNRFNEKVFEGKDGWDCTLNCALAKKGVKADPGVYYYYLTFPDGSTHKGIIEVVKF